MKRCLWLLPLLMFGASRAEAAPKKANRTLLRAPRGYSSGYRPYIKWRVTLGLGENTSPAIADVDLDGTMDILLPALDGEEGPTLYRLTQDGEVKWSSALPARATAGVSLGDVDRNGSTEIVLACDKTLLCFDVNGKEKWRRTFRAPVSSQPTLADLEGDGRAEILVGTQDNNLYALDARGKTKWSYATKSWISSGIATADVDGDGKLEVGFGSLDAFLYCLDARGKLRWRYRTGDWIQGGVVWADVDRDGGTDLLAASDDGNLYCLSRRGTLKWREGMGGARRNRAQLSVTDLDGDGTLETLVTSNDGYLRCFTAFGDRVWQSYDGNTGPSSDANVASIGTPLVVDLNRDNQPEIVVAGRDGQLRGFSVWGQTVFQIAVGGRIEGSPLLFDADRDGRWEIYVGNIADSEGNAGFFSQYELSVKGGRGQWTTLGGDPYRTDARINARDYGANLFRGGDYATAWEPFGVAYRPRTGTRPPRQLRVSALPLQDLNGNRDGVLDAGETALWRVQVENFGRGASYDNTLAVSLDNPILRIDRARSYLGWLAPGARKIATFRVSAPTQAQLLAMQQEEEREQATPFREIKPATAQELAQEPAQSPLKPPSTSTRRRKKVRATGDVFASLQVRESNVQAAVSRARLFRTPPLPPRLKIARTQIFDSNSRLTQGNGNGRLEAGESAILRLWLRNENLSTAQTATATLRAASSDVLVSTPLVNLKNVVPFGGRQIDFSLRVAKQIQKPTIALTLVTQPVVKLGAPVPAGRETITLALRSTGLDLEPPRIILRSPQTLIASTSAKTFAIVGAISDASGLQSFRFAGKNIALANLPLQNGARIFRFVRPLNVGENVFALNATDKRGNSVSSFVRLVRKPAGTTTSPKPSRRTRTRRGR